MESEFVISDKYQETFERINGIPIRLDEIKTNVRLIVESCRYGLYSIGQYYILDNNTTMLAPDMKDKPITRIYSGSLCSLSDSNRKKNRRLETFIQQFYNIDFKSWYTHINHNGKLYREQHLYPFLEHIAQSINDHTITKSSHIQCHFNIIKVTYTDYGYDLSPFIDSFTPKPIKPRLVLGIELHIKQSDYYMRCFKEYPTHYLEDRYILHTEYLKDFVDNAMDNLFYAIYRTSLANPNTFIFENDNEEFHYRIATFRDLEPEQIVNEIRKHPILSKIFTIREDQFKIKEFKGYCPDICYPLFDRLSNVLTKKYLGDSPFFFQSYCIFDEETQETIGGGLTVQAKLERFKTMGTLSKTLGMVIGFKKKHFESVVNSKLYKKWFKQHEIFILNAYIQELSNRVSELERKSTDSDTE